jgi:AmmeMemoRadiSam system protein A
MERLAEARGAFVTLKERGELRGCIGYMSPVKPLCMTVRDVAAEAALHDPRFAPVAPRELGDLEYEISVLSPLRRVTDWGKIQVGRDGLLVRRGEYEGVLLPQVATEEHWDRNTFLDETCMKAGLAPGCWKDQETDVFAFTAVVFGESSLTPPAPDDSDRVPKDLRGRPAPTLPPH